LELIMD